VRELRPNKTRRRGAGRSLTQKGGKSRPKATRKLLLKKNVLIALSGANEIAAAYRALAQRLRRDVQIRPGDHRPSLLLASITGGALSGVFVRVRIHGEEVSGADKVQERTVSVDLATRPTGVAVLTGG
jgi:hypothetical protein